MGPSSILADLFLNLVRDIHRHPDHIAAAAI